MPVTRRSAILMGLTGVCGAPNLLVPAPKHLSRETGLDLQEVIKRHTEARGGAAALDAIRNHTVELWITEKASTITAKYMCTDDPSFRIDVFDRGKHVFCEGLDADGPWIWPGGAPEPTQGVPDAKRTGLQGIEFNLYGLHSFQRRGHKLSLVGTEKVEGRDLYVVSIEMKDSYQTFVYIDPCSWQIVRRRDVRAFHPDVDSTRKAIEVQYTDFRSVTGVRTPFVDHQVDMATGKITQMTAVQSAAYNTTVTPAMIARTFR